MNVFLQEHDATNAVLKVTLEPADYQPAVAAKLKDFGKRATIKGFRPGKVPPALIKKMYGKEVLVQEVFSQTSKAVTDYIKGDERNWVGEPLPETNEEQLNWDAPEEFAFEYAVGFAPHFTVNLGPDTVVPTYAVRLTDQELDETIERLRKRYPRFADVDAVVSQEDRVRGTLHYPDGELYHREVTFTINKLAEENRAAWMGAVVGAQFTLDLSTAFENADSVPEMFVLDDEAEEMPPLDVHGPRTFTMTAVQRSSDAPLDQAFFDAVLGKDKATGEEEFRVQLNDYSSRSFMRSANTLLAEKLRDTVVGVHPFDLPDAYLKRWLAVSNEGKFSEAQIEKEYEEFALNLRWSLIKNQIAAKANLQVTHEEVVAHTTEMMNAQYSFASNTDFMRKLIDDMVQNFLKGEKGANYRQMFNQAFDNKVITYTLDQITLDKQPLTSEEFRQLIAARTPSADVEPVTLQLEEQSSAAQPAAELVDALDDQPATEEAAQ